MAVFGPAMVARASDGSMRVKKGRASFSVAPHGPRSPFVVQVGSDRVVVHGTKFDVHVKAGRLARVDVAEGRVEVQRAGEAPRMVTGGGSLAIDDTVAPTRSLESFEAPWWHSGDKPAPSADGKGYLFVETDPPGAEVSLDGVSIGRAPLLVRWRSGKPVVALALEGHTSWTGSIPIRPGRVVRLTERLAAPAVARSDEPPPARRPKQSDRWRTARTLLRSRQCDRLDRVVKQIVRESDVQAQARAETLGAECRLRRGAKAAALSRYLRILDRYPETQSAEAALFEAGNLELDLGHREQALSRTDLYLSRHPQGRFSEAAAIRRCELLVSASRLTEARECLERYGHDHPKGLRASQALLLLATIARIEGRWAEAVPAYREYLSRAGASERAETAQYHLIECLLRGKLDGADEAISDYLAHHPGGAHAEEVEKWRQARASSR